MHAVLEAIRLLHGCDDLNTLSERVLEATRLLVSCDTATYTEINHARRRAVHRSGDAAFDEEMAAVAPAFEQFCHQHPIAEFARHDPVPVTKIGDFLTQRELRQLGVHRDCFRRIGINRQIGVCLSSAPNLVVGVGLNRVRVAFNERDRDRLALLRPHLVEAYRSTCLRSDLQEQLRRYELALDTLNFGLLTIDDDGGINSENSIARSALKACFPGWSGRSTRLPSPLCDWWKHTHRDVGRIDRPDAANAEQDFIGPNGRLNVRLLLGESRNDFTLLLRYNEAFDPVMRLRRDGLTRREAETLHRLTLGETNREIANALGISSGTVRTHIERVLGKLDVATRTAAAGKAMVWLNEG